MFVSNLNLAKTEICKFEFAYSALHPKEIAPDFKILKELEKDADKIFIGKYNICLFKELNNDTYEAIAFWCIASERLLNNENKRCFLEIIRATLKLKKKVIITNINGKYKKVVENISEDYCLFKVTK